MKKTLITLAVFAAIAVSPAHAISAKYRAQLERSGCTQMTDGNGCDIHKTKTQNAAAANTPKGHQAKTLKQVIDAEVIGATDIDSFNALTREGFKQYKGKMDVWQRDRDNVRVGLDIQNGKVLTASIYAMGLK